MTITWTFAPGQIIFSSRFNTNFSDVKSWADAHELLNSGTHGITGNFVDTGTPGQIITVTKTFTLPKIRGAGAGVVTLQNANTALNLTITIPDSLINADFVLTEGSQNINGIKRFAALAAVIKGAGAGAVSLQYENSAANRTHTIPAKSTDDVFAMITDLVAPASAPIGLITNARLTLTAGRLKLVGNNGSDPSVTNPVYFITPSNTAGGWTQSVFTSTTNCTIDDATTADSYFNGGGGAAFGTTAGVAWSNTMPFGIFLVTDGTTPVLFLGRRAQQITTLAARVAYKDNPGISTNESFFGWTATNVSATHANRRAYLVGSVRMTKNASDDWTFAALDTGDGFGVQNYNFGVRDFDMPTGQMGASAGSYFLPNGGTAPTYTGSNLYKYAQTLDGRYKLKFSFTNAAGGTAGAGASALILSTPMELDFNEVGNFEGYNNGAAFWVLGQCYNSSFGMSFTYQATLTNIGSIANDDQNNATRYITGSGTFRIN